MKIRRIIAAGIIGLSVLVATVARAQDSALPGMVPHGQYSGSLSYGGTTGNLVAHVSGNAQGSSGTVSGTMSTLWGGTATCYYSYGPSMTGCNYLYLPGPSGCSPTLGGILFLCYEAFANQQVCNENLNGTYGASSSKSKSSLGNYLIPTLQSDLGVNSLGLSGACPANRPDIIHIWLSGAINGDCDFGWAGSHWGICNEDFTIVAPSNADISGGSEPITGHMDYQGEAGE